MVRAAAIAAGLTRRADPRPSSRSRRASCSSIETPPAPPTAAVIDGDGDGRRAHRRPDRRSSPTDSRGEGPLVVTIDDVGTYRVEAYRVGQSVVVVGLSRDRGRRDDRARCSRRSACSPLGGLLLLAAATAWTIRARPRAAARRRRHRRRGSRRCRSTRARSRSPSGCPHAEADPRTEVGRVGEALNTLLDHVDESLDARQRNEERMRRVRRRREPRAAHAARLDPRLLRALAARAQSQSHDAAARSRRPRRRSSASRPSRCA